ncbi:MAG: VOC family protein [Candidatus Poribacteria bacterium]|nr:VOC family protein [Candidatus Poribacteria bacterium]
MNGMLEHANISVKDVDEAVRFFTTAFPHWKVRGTGGEPPAHWVHLGTDDQYLCLGAPDNHDSRTQGHRGYGVNHIGFVVDDADAVRQRLLDAGFNEGFKADPNESRKRVYLKTSDGMEVEFVQYYSDDPAIRNKYE